MGVKRVTAEEALAALDNYDAVIDARSESEFAEDHLPGAHNWPVLNDAERAAVGTEYQQVSPFDARKRGAALVSANIARLVTQHVQPQPRGWRPLVYCWRGGQRSGSLALVLGEIGFHTHVLEGGYRAFRKQVMAELDARAPQLPLRVVLGRTGSAKTRLLHALAAAGEQVLDLEALACHKGSVLGPLPGQPQPGQKAFETALWQALRGLDIQRPVWVEGESRTIGRLRLPEPLLQRMRLAPCVQVELPLAERVRFLLRDYRHFVEDPGAFGERLQALRELQGAETVQRWQAQALAGDLATVVQELLQRHYDPVYTKSLHKHFAGLAQAPLLPLADAEPATLAAAAAQLAHDARRG
jgi:tRNA 2-selenouridine synthase